MTRIEELAAQSAIAIEAAEKESAAFRRLQSELECDATNLSCGDYANLQTRCSQQERRADAAIRRACERQAALDEERSKESARLSREAARRAVDDVLNRLSVTRAESAAKREELRRLQNELPLIEQKASFLLNELDRAKTALQQSEAR